MATSVIQPAAGSRIGPGSDVNIGLGGASVLNDTWNMQVQVGVTPLYSPVIMEMRLAAGLHTPDGVIGWDYILNQYILPSLGGIADGTAVNLIVEWRSAAGALKGTSTTAFVWDAAGQVSFLLNFLLGGHDPMLDTILARVTNNLPKLP